MEQQQINQNRMVLLLIAGIPVTMILAATWLWYYVVNGELDLIDMVGTANSGELVQPPRQIDDSELLLGTLPYQYSDGGTKWSLLVPHRGLECGAACEQSLYVTRQIHIAMGKEFNRIDRLYVGDTPLENVVLTVAQLSDGKPTPETLGSYLEYEHRGLQALRVTAVEHEELFAELSADPSSWYLVDPRGWIMMSYNSEVDYKDVISDLKFLLKNSSE